MRHEVAPEQQGNIPTAQGAPVGVISLSAVIGGTPSPSIWIVTRFVPTRSPPALFHSPPIIRAAYRRQRRWVRRALADIPPPRSHPLTVASPAAHRSANVAQAPACRARMNS